MARTHDLGLLGGGQLARMTIMAAQRMGLACLSLDSDPNSPAAQVAPALRGDITDPAAIAELLRSCGAVTLENEFIPAHRIRQALRFADRDESCLTPSADCLEAIQDKLVQRRALARYGVPNPLAVPIDPNSAELAAQEIGYPMVLKARFGGYDGKGTRIARTPQELESHRPLWSSGTWLAEKFVPFVRELAVMAYRSPSEAGCFPTMETRQEKNVCDLVLPCEADAGPVARAAVEAVGGFGLFGVEMFELGDGSILVNEIAPRPHNSGHYTLDWGGISQFEQHVRLAMGLPCDLPEGNPTCMANLLGQPNAGDWRPALRRTLLGYPMARIHWYGKCESREGRKMGHLNVSGPHCEQIAVAARKLFYSAWTNTEQK